MPKKIIAIAIGGNSSEYQTSIKSGTHLYQTLLQSSYYSAFLVEFKNKTWFVLDKKNGKKYPINKNNFSFKLENIYLCFDAVLNMIHGSIGESGVLVSYLDLVGVPYTCSNAFASTLSYGKRECLAFLNRIGVKSAPAIYLSKKIEYDLTEIEEKVGFPCMVKANREGSSFGALYTSDKEKFKDNIQKAFKFDSELIVEKFIKGIEVSIGAYLDGSQIQTLPATEIIPEGLFFDYDAKYLGKSKEITPARIETQQRIVLEKTMKKIFLHLNLKGFARFDFILQGNTAFFLEVNTVPGMTQESLFPQQLNAQGIALLKFLESMLDQTIKEHTQKSR